MDYPVFLGLIGGALFVYRLLLTVYRLVFHPLAEFPGPKLAAATRLYEAYYDVLQGGKYIFQIGELHKQYGKSCRELPTPSGCTKSRLRLMQFGSRTDRAY